jgi:predicted ATPase
VNEAPQPDKPKSGFAATPWLGGIAAACALLAAVAQPEEMRRAIGKVAQWLWPLGVVLLLAIACIALVTVMVRMRRARAGQPSGPGRPVTGQVPGSTEPGAPQVEPPPPGDFIGREQDVANLVDELLDPRTSLVTVLGLPGVGKTRLCKEVLALPRLRNRFAGEARFIDLTEARSAADIAIAVAKEFGVPLGVGKSPEEAAADLLQLRPRSLLVLDNFEQVVETAVTTVGRWRQQAPNVKLLLTSREPLGLAGERKFLLKPLEPPREGADPKALLQAPPASIRLFELRAVDYDRDFRLGSGNIAAVAAICLRLEGLPLAIEIAAAHVASMQLDEILRAITGKLEFLRTDRRDIPERHQTLAAAIDSLLDSLPAAERLAILQASIFRGGLLLDAFEAVVARRQDRAATSLVDSLVWKSLLLAVPTPHGTRYHQYVAVRGRCEDAWNRQATEEQKAELVDRYTGYYIRAGEAWDRQLWTDQIQHGLDRLEAEHENLVQAYEQLLLRGDSSRAALAFLTLTWMLRIRQPTEDRQDRLAACLPGLQTGGSKAVLVRVLTERGIALSDLGQMSEAWESIASAVEHAGGLGATDHAFQAHRWKAILEAGPNDFNSAMAELTIAESIAEELGDARLRAMVHRDRGDLIARFQPYADDNVRRALASYQAGRAVLEGVDAPRLAALLLLSEAIAYSQLGEDAQEQARLEAAAQLADSYSDAILRSHIATQQAQLLITRGFYDAAARSFATLEQEVRGWGDKRRTAQALVGRGLALASGEETRRAKAREALQCYDEAEVLWKDTGDEISRAITLSNRAYLLLRTDSPRPALKDAEAAVGIFEQHDRLWQAVGFIVQAIHVRCKAAAGDEAEGRRLACELLAESERRGFGVEHSNPEVHEHAEALTALCASSRTATEDRADAGGE